jgi:hypothetical protein
MPTWGIHTGGNEQLFFSPIIKQVTIVRLRPAGFGEMFNAEAALSREE